MTTNHLRHLPVIDPEGKLVGILSERDLERARNVEVEEGEEIFTFKTTKRVCDYMSKPVKTMNESASIRLLASEILKNKISSFVIEDHDGNLKGIVTTDDLLKYLLQMIDFEQMEYDKTALSIFEAVV